MSLLTIDVAKSNVTASPAAEVATPDRGGATRRKFAKVLEEHSEAKVADDTPEGMAKEEQPPTKEVGTTPVNPKDKRHKAGKGVIHAVALDALPTGLSVVPALGDTSPKIQANSETRIPDDAKSTKTATSDAGKVEEIAGIDAKAIGSDDAVSAADLNGKQNVEESPTSVDPKELVKPDDRVQVQNGEAIVAPEIPTSILKRTEKEDHSKIEKESPKKDKPNSDRPLDADAPEVNPTTSNESVGVKRKATLTAATGEEPRAGKSVEHSKPVEASKSKPSGEVSPLPKENVARESDGESGAHEASQHASPSGDALKRVETVSPSKAEDAVAAVAAAAHNIASPTHRVDNTASTSGTSVTSTTASSPDETTEAKPGASAVTQGVSDATGVEARPQIQSSTLLKHAGNSELQVGVQTSEFGRVEVHATLHENQLAATVKTESADLRHSLANELPKLGEQLGHREMGVERISVTAFGGGLSEKQGRGQDAQPRVVEEQATQSAWSENRKSAMRQVPTIQSNPWLGRGLDLFV